MGNIKRLAIGYIAAAWIIVQILDVLGDSWGIPSDAVRGIHIVLVVGFLIVLAYSGLHSRKAQSERPAAGRSSKSLLTIGGWLLAGLMVASLGFTISSSNQTSHARTVTLPEAQRLAEQERYGEALALAEEAARYLDEDPAIEVLFEQISEVIDITTDPDGTDVYVKAYSAADSAWELVGQTPIHALRAPLGTRQWRLEKEGYETVIRVPPTTQSIDVKLSEAGTTPERMVFVPGGFSVGWTSDTGMTAPVTLPDHYYDRFEVTNREFLEFVRADGYEKVEYWSELPLVGEHSAAISSFVDSTGERGPANWEVGAPRSGTERYPVSGVSWYEAAAYCRSVGKSLPTIYHWSSSSGVFFIAGDVSGLSNFSGDGPSLGEESRGIGTYGAVDLAGNMREWIWNPTVSGRLILGGAWNDPEYFISHAQNFDPMDRSPGNGFRCILEMGESADSDTILGEIVLSIRDYYSEIPVSDDVFEVYRRQFDYDDTSLDAKTERTGETSDRHPYEVVSFSAPYFGSRMQALVMLPDDLSSPRQAVVMYPGSSAMIENEVEVLARNPSPDVSALLRSGRTVAVPVLKGTFSRQDGLDTTWPSQTKNYTDYAIRWVQEVSRTLDYLESRPDIDADTFAYMGISWGGRMGVIVMAVEDRFKVGMLLSGGLAPARSLPEVDQINFVTRVTKPILILNGLRDSIEPYETAQKPLYDLLGTADQNKRHVTFPDTGHNLPRTPMIREVLSWLDQYAEQ